jgi:hypothetical protein
VPHDAMAGAPVHCESRPLWERVGLGVLAGHVPVEVIDEVLAATGRVQQRIRLLPARVTVLFILGLAVFSGNGYRAVWRDMAHSGGDHTGAVPSSTALTQAWPSAIAKRPAAEIKPALRRRP